MANRGFRPGERLTRAGLNQKLNDAGKGRVHGPRVRERQGKTILADEEFIFLKITEVSSTGPKRYGWKEVHHNKDTGNWEDSPRTGTIDTDPAFEIAGAVLTAGNTVYRAERSRASGAWMVRSGGGSGSLDVKGKDIVVMILGTEEEYDTCEGAPPASPGCWQGYAFAAYKVCGYTYTKIFDARDLGKWALELNGGTTTAWRRFHPAFWGWDNYTEGLPTAATACEGVRFINPGTSALSCSCPSWINDLDCIKLQFTTPVRPTSPPECSTAVSNMDSAGAWDKTVSVILCRNNSCSFSGTAYNGLFTVSLAFEEIPRTDPECFWGPASFDPCDPCASFGRFFICIEINGGNEPNCGSGCHYTGQFRLNDMKSLHDNCLTGNGTLSISPYNSVMCNGCGNSQTPPAIYYFVNANSVVLKCCTTEETASCP